MENQFSASRILKRGVISGLIFTTLWSSWAYFINVGNGESAAQKAALTQASFTIVNAFIFTVIMESMYNLGKNKIQRFFYAFVFPNILVTVALTYLHYLRETPQIFSTVAPVLSFVMLLSGLYVFWLAPTKIAALSNKTRIQNNI